MKKTSDTEIRARVRSIVAHYRLEMQSLQLRITGGTVRVAGRLAFLGGSRDALPLCVVEGFERDLTRVRGVGQLYFDLKNWRRFGPGEWAPARPARKRASVAPDATTESVEELVAVGETEPVEVPLAA